MKKCIALLAAFLLLLGLFSACGRAEDGAASDVKPSEPSPVQSAAPTPEAEPQDPFVVGTTRQYKYFGFQNDFLFGNVFECLTRLIPGTFEVEGVLAESWQRSDDGLVWTFKIKDDVYFSNGVACDAKTVARSLEYAAQMYSTLNAYGYTISAREGNVVEFKFEQQVDNLEYILADWPMAVAEPGSIGEGMILSDCVAGTGPYMTDGPDEEGSWTLRRVNNYHDEAARIDTVHVRCFASEEKMAQSLLSGELDHAVFSDTTLFDEIIESCAQDAWVEYAKANPLWFNPAVIPQLAMPEVRRAMSLFIDLEGVNNEVFGGYGRLQKSIWAEGSYAYLEAPEKKYDPEQGLALLASVGMAPEDFEFTNQLFSDDDFNAISRCIGEQLSQLGMKVEQFELNMEAASTSPLMRGDWVIWSGVGEDSFNFVRLWQYTLPEMSLISFDVDAFGEDISGALRQECELMLSAPTWEETLEHSKNITRIMQDEYIIHPGVQTPRLVVLQNGYSGYTRATNSNGVEAMLFANMKKE